SFYQQLKQLIDDQVIGELKGLHHVENIGNYHMAHSFVRGNWRNSALTSPIILSKTCHDMDIITYLLDRECLEVYSKGYLSYFNKHNKPANATYKCLDCPLVDTCLYSAKKVYLDPNHRNWPIATLCADPTPSNVLAVLNETNYGTCVYQIPDNDVCDHQVAILSFSDHLDVTFTVTAFTNNQYRTTNIYGTTGSIYANTKDNLIVVTPHTWNENAANCIKSYYPQNTGGGHGGGDYALMEDFINMLKDDNHVLLSSPSQSIQSHFMSYACEESRITKQPVNLKEYKKSLF
ncbi:MAG: Gfo/Idh/MocA family oxidoreductase, partial [Bacilli bacterium]